MPTSLDDRSTSLLRGLSDFWTRFFADTPTLEGLFNASEIQLAQAYFDILQSFLGISVQDVPLFRKELFKLLTIREDRVTFREATNPGASRYVHVLPEAITAIAVLQNKVFEPTAALVPSTDYDLDAGNYELQLAVDPTGSVGRVLGTSTAASLLTYGTGALTRCYVTEGTPFTDAKPGHWVRLLNSAVGNNQTYRVAEVIDAQAVLLAGNITLPDPNTGFLQATLLDSEFTTVPGFAKRVLTVAMGGSFDDAARRLRDSEQGSWIADWPIGLGIRKGDILRVLDQSAVPTTPVDYNIALVRHERCYLSTQTPLSSGTGPQLSDAGRTATADPVTDRITLATHGFAINTRVMLTTTGTMPGGLIAGCYYYVRELTGSDFKLAANAGGVALPITSAGTGTLTVYGTQDGITPRLVRDYVILRQPAEADVVEEPVLFTETGTPKIGATGQLINDVLLGPCLFDAGAAFDPSSDRQRFVTISGSATITCTADLGYGNTLTRTAGMLQPFARASAGGQVKITTGTQLGSYFIQSVAADGKSVVLDGSPFTPELGVAVEIQVVTNSGTYRIRKVGGSNRHLVLDQLFGYPDANNGTLSWRVHDGYQTALVHTRVVRGSAQLTGSIGDADTGGVHEPRLGEDYTVDYEAGVLLQLGRLAGLWGLDATDKICTADPTTDLLTASGHGFSDTNDVVFWTPSVLPQGLTAGTKYVRDAALDTFRVAESIGGTAIDLLDAGSGTLHVRRANGRALNLASYGWLQEVVAETTSATAALYPDETEADVAEIAFWVPDAQVDLFRLYDNFGYLIGRFQASSEAYRQFIRGVFQLYLLGPTLERVESALNVICALPVARDDGETLMSYEAAGTILDDPAHARITTHRPDGNLARYLFPAGTPIRSDISAYVPGTSSAISFLSFEAFTELFQIVDWTEDALWWDSIIVPQALMPGESTARRTTVPVLYENTIGQIDDPHIGDPGFFIGADDDGVVPPWSVAGGWSSGTALAFPFAPSFGGVGVYIAAPALRRKMVNVVVDKYIKRNLFYVYFDAALSVLFPADFINDLRDLVLIAKPGYTLVYVEPASHFVDVMQMSEQALVFAGDLALLEPAPVGPERPLLIGGQWNIGDSFRHEAALLSQALLTADGATVPAPVALVHDHLTLQRVVCPGAPILEDTDYTVNYLTGVVTPITVWPIGVYTIDYSHWTITPAASADPANGDTPYMIGGQELWFGNLGTKLYGDVKMPVLTEQPLQIAVVPAP